MSDFVAYCKACETAPECHHAFGAYWWDKSHGGLGCRIPFRPAWRLADITPSATEQMQLPQVKQKPTDPPWAKYVAKPKRSRNDRAISQTAVADKLRLLRAIN